MDQLLHKLIEILRVEKQILYNLLQLSHTKTNLLLEANVDAINNIILQEHELKFTLDTAEKKRERVVVDIATALQEDASHITISDIIEKTDLPLNQELKTVKNEMHDQLTEYKGINEINLALIQSHLYFVDFMVNTISGRQTQAIIYGSQGYTVADEKRNYFFDNKA
ncbi:MAG: flagellar protein FlgN [Hyphomonadaceae bacterium]|nr:flagellar protein FlgN [Clostridia bacterium]